MAPPGKCLVCPIISPPLYMGGKATAYHFHHFSSQCKANICCQQQHSLCILSATYYLKIHSYHLLLIINYLLEHSEGKIVYEYIIQFEQLMYPKQIQKKIQIRSRISLCDIRCKKKRLQIKSWGFFTTNKHYFQKQENPQS